LQGRDNFFRVLLFVTVVLDNYSATRMNWELIA